jgi:hypothetical protein
MAREDNWGLCRKCMAKNSLEGGRWICGSIRKTIFLIVMKNTFAIFLSPLLSIFLIMAREESMGQCRRSMAKNSLVGGCCSCGRKDWKIKTWKTKGLLQIIKHINPLFYIERKLEDPDSEVEDKVDVEAPPDDVFNM